MTEYRRTVWPTGDLPDGDERASSPRHDDRDVVEQSTLDAGECTHVICKNVEVNVGYQGLVDGSQLSQAAAVGEDLRSAWRTQLEDEGKRSSGTKTLRDVIFGSDEPT